MPIEEARALIEKAHEAMAIVNAAILANPAANVYDHHNSSTIQEAIAPAPPLNYQNPNATLARRQLSNSTYSNGTSSTSARSYTIPSELVKAAAVLAEAAPPTINMGDYVRGNDMRRLFAPRRNNTNAMRQKIRRPSGLIEPVIFDETEADQYRLREQEDTIIPPSKGNNATSSGTKLPRQSTPFYWLQDHERRGSSPFAPAGYEVCCPTRKE
jgi:hypothetical protein